jgi:hypothetical protein
VKQRGRPPAHVPFMSDTKSAMIRLVEFRSRPTLGIKTLHSDGATALASIAEITCFLEYATLVGDNVSESFDEYRLPDSIQRPFDDVEEIFDSIFCHEAIVREIGMYSFGAHCMLCTISIPNNGIVMTILMMEIKGPLVSWP